jgi:hypothetical protein
MPVVRSEGGEDVSNFNTLFRRAKTLGAVRGCRCFSGRRTHESGGLSQARLTSIQFGVACRAEPLEFGDDPRWYDPDKRREAIAGWPDPRGPAQGIAQPRLHDTVILAGDGAAA